MMPVLGVSNRSIEKSRTRWTTLILGENETKRNGVRIESNRIPLLPSIGVNNMPIMENKTKQNSVRIELKCIAQMSHNSNILQAARQEKTTKWYTFTKYHCGSSIFYRDSPIQSGRTSTFFIMYDNAVYDTVHTATFFYLYTELFCTTI